MDLTFPPEAETGREEVRTFLAANLRADWLGLGSRDQAEAEVFSNAHSPKTG